MLKELAEPEKAASKSDKPAEGGRTESRFFWSQGQATVPPELDRRQDREGDHRQGRQAIHAQISDAGKVSPKDQALDELLGKLGETKDEPTPEDRPRNGGAGGEPKQPPPRAEKPAPTKLGGKDKDLDERLEELTGRKKKRPSADEERSGPIGEIIKEMGTSSSGWASPIPAKTLRRSKSRSSSASRR